MLVSKPAQAEIKECTVHFYSKKGINKVCTLYKPIKKFAHNNPNKNRKKYKNESNLIAGRTKMEIKFF
jgi:hypothetical protein